MLDGYLSHTSQEKTMFLRVSEVTDFVGRPPCPRIQASSCALENGQNEKLLVIYGGRNDSIFAHTQNVALNDVCIFNLNQKCWISLTMYGTLPTSRWSHIMVPNRSHDADGFIVFGGVSLDSYCKPRLHSFSVLRFGAKSQIEE